MKNSLLIFIISVLISGCKQSVSETGKTPVTHYNIEDAKGFSIYEDNGYKVIEVSHPWPDAEKEFTYVLLKKGQQPPDNIQYDAIVEVPVKRLVATSTTHIPALEALHIENTLVGFPDTKYISSERSRKNIDAGKVVDLGINEAINTEILIDLDPDLVMGFSINDQNKTYTTIINSGIPVVYNGDWVEQTPLGKAEWIKFIAPFFGKEKEADSIFDHIKTEYLKAKELAVKAKEKPSVFSGSMFKDVWYMPAGESWIAHFFNDANANYLWKDSEGNGSISLNFESVLEKAQDADFWIGAMQFTSYDELEIANPHYRQFKVFGDKNIYTISLTKGETGGMLFYELAANRPDIVVNDLIHIFHPELLPEYEPYFFKPLN